MSHLLYTTTQQAVNVYTSMTDTEWGFTALLSGCLQQEKDKT